MIMVRRRISTIRKFILQRFPDVFFSHVCMANICELPRYIQSTQIVEHRLAVVPIEMAVTVLAYITVAFRKAVGTQPDETFQKNN
jgi:hypothetical protein